jgi:ADP-ribose pyrophosphatase YjhB (NUDIX family)
VKPGVIRPLAICLFRRGDNILVAEGHDRVKGETFYRPLGGAIEFGEYATDALRREVREEINAEIKDLEYLGTFENIFEYEGEPGHEIVLVFDGAFVDASLYKRPELKGREDNGAAFRALWKPLLDFRRAALLYPAGLLDLIDRLASTRR